MAKQILVLLGSPRKNGNSAILAKQIAKGAKAGKAKVETVFLQEKDIAPCRGCMHCQKKGSKGCAIKDDMQEIYGKLIAADCGLIAIPGS
ncbi:MAG: flavodoxin family protein [Deltaproteobacteria bacterium]|nr:flavodoxin family protein [Deltaproteobacteria bacterium]